tara:strand:+ start:5305 stop:5763 length:459 start_codon:yes stop_codon:yes gene_type:complete
MNIKNLKTYGLSLAIIIVLTIFVNVGIATFYPQPDYEDCFFPRSIIEKEDINDKEFEEKQKEAKECDDKNRDVRSFYNRNVFIILSIVGIITIGISLLLTNLPIVSGLMYGGILNILMGIMRYWSNMNEYLRFIVSGIILIILIYIAYKKFK